MPCPCRPESRKQNTCEPGLGNVQFVKDGDRLSDKASAESDFDALDDEDVLGGDAGEELPDYLR